MSGDRSSPVGRVLLTLDETAAALGISTRTVRREIQKGNLPVPIRMASKLMMPADELRSAIDQKKRERRH